DLQPGHRAHEPHQAEPAVQQDLTRFSASSAYRDLSTPKRRSRRFRRSITITHAVENLWITIATRREKVETSSASFVDRAAGLAGYPRTPAPASTVPLHLTPL